MKTKIYLDTSVISALFDSRTPERQAMTHSAWEQLNDYDVFVSEIVIDELSKTPESLRASFFERIKNFKVLSVTESAHSLAQMYVAQGIFTQKYYDDALHVAVASVNQVSILLSWNFRHLVKLKTRRMVSLVNVHEDYMPVEIISPPEL
jgi:predicted nucleic acid-binding protein